MAKATMADSNSLDAVKAAAAAKPSITPSRLRALIRAGLVAAIVAAGVLAMTETFEASRKCRGGFSRGFSADFDLYRCELIIRLLRAGSQIIKIPLP
jgi:hypothetical protein